MRYILPLFTCLFSCFSCAAVPVKPEPSKSADIQTTNKVSIEINDRISEQSVKGIIQTVKTVLKQGGNVTEIWFRINSFGGEVDAGNKLIDLIEQLPVKTVCVADHRAYSMGFVILESCDVRLMTKRTMLMAHEPSVSEVNGNEHELKRIAELLQKGNIAMAEFIAPKLHMSVKEYLAKINDKEWWMTADDAKKSHAVDDFVDPKDIPPSVVAVPVSDLSDLFP